MSVDTSHYDCFNLKLTEEEIASGFVRLDPYKVSKVWDIGTKDPSGCLFHILKTISRFGTKGSNTKLRELASIESTITRKIQLHDEDY